MSDLKAKIERKRMKERQRQLRKRWENRDTEQERVHTYWQGKTKYKNTDAKRNEDG